MANTQARRSLSLSDHLPQLRPHQPLSNEARSGKMPEVPSNPQGNPQGQQPPIIVNVSVTKPPYTPPAVQGAELRAQVGGCGCGCGASNGGGAGV
jgi:hypothetical protein